MDPPTAPTVDVSAFRKAMGSFPTGVTVVTVACGDGDMHGVTVNSFSSVSPEPMPVLARLNQTSRAPDQTLDLAPSISLVGVIAEGS